MTKKIKYGIIGTGLMGCEHISNLNLIDEAEVIAICDTNKDSLVNATSLIKNNIEVSSNYNNFFKKSLDFHDKKVHPHFLCVGRFLKRKNHITLLKAYSKYQEENGKLGLKLIGSGPLESNIKDVIRTLPNCSLASILPFQQLEELRVSYKQASAFILASTQDTWGLVINEAMASGLPCIASTACGCTQDLIENNVSGFSFDPMDSKKLTEIMHLIERQTSSERIAMKSAGKQRLQNYTPETFAIGLEKSINYAIKKNNFSKSAVVMAEFISRCLKFL